MHARPREHRVRVHAAHCLGTTIAWRHAGNDAEKMRPKDDTIGRRDVCSDEKKKPKQKKKSTIQWMVQTNRVPRMSNNAATYGENSIA